MKIEIDGKELDLRLDMLAYERIESKYENYGKFIDELQAGRSRAIIDAIFLFANSGELYAGREENIRRGWIASHMRPGDLRGGVVSEAIRETLADGMRSEAAKHERIDLVLAELKKKETEP